MDSSFCQFSVLGIQKYSLIYYSLVNKFIDLSFFLFIMWFHCCHTGEGQFGKVYACVNLDTGELMAVKQVQVV